MLTDWTEISEIDTGFCLLTAIIFHRNLADQTQMIMFFKNLSIAGGFLLLVANGAGPLSLDARSERKHRA
ncbi:MAG: DoxX family protein [Steroidobacteraceae bacterium]